MLDLEAYKASTRIALHLKLGMETATKKAENTIGDSAALEISHD
jgi:hypothetical protein